MIGEIDARIKRALGGLRQSFRGVITLVKAAGSVQFVQVDGFSGEQLQDNELFQHYGFTSNPRPGTMAVVLPIGGKTAHGIIIATEHGNYRLKNLESGEVAIYDDRGQKVHLTRNGILIDGAGFPIKIENTLKVDIDTPDVNMTGRLNVTGDVQITGSITNKGKNIGSDHRHADVETGTGISGEPV